MTEEFFKQDRFSHAILLNSSIDDVFKLIATSEGICKWFMGTAKNIALNGKERNNIEIVQTSDEYEWQWLKKNLKLKGRILEVKNPNIIRFTFSPLYIVTINLSEDNNRVKLILEQECTKDFNGDSFNYFNCCVCWVFFLTNLKSVIENGIDLRETEIIDEMLINQ